MEFLDGADSRSRFVLQPKSQTSSVANVGSRPQSSLRIVTAFLSILLSIISLLYVETEPYKSLLIWVSLSLFLGPFAPSNLTGGDVTVGQGSPLDFPEEDEHEETQDAQLERRGARRRSKTIKTSEADTTSSIVVRAIESGKRESGIGVVQKQGGYDVEETEWSEEDLWLLKKQMAKNPAGKPGRWEAVAMAFNGRHKVDSVIKKAKELGDLRSDDNSDFDRFLKNRKPLDARVKEEIAAAGGEGGWSIAEDVALLNAMKAFPKEAEMRWEKIAAALPGKSKADCTKRVHQLKKNFRDSKSSL